MQARELLRSEGDRDKLFNELNCFILWCNTCVCSLSTRVG